MKPILVYFYPGNNLGDDLFLRILSDRYKKQKFEIAVCKGYQDISLKNFRVSRYAKINFWANKQLSRQSSSKLWTLIKIFANKITQFSENRLKNKKYKARILITGSLFQQGKKCDNTKPQILEKLNEKCDNFLIDANFGPFFENEFLEQYRKGFENFKSISFRDKHSFEFFKDMPNAIYAPDVVLSGNFPKPTDIKSNNIVFSVMDFSIKPQLKQYVEDYENKAVEIIEKFSKEGKSVTLMSFCSLQGDDKAVKSILDKCNSKHISNVKSYFYNNNIDEALKIIAKSEFVIATRFHSMILGWYYDKKVFPIVYGEKMQHCLEDFNYNDNYIMLENIQNLDINRVFESYTNDTDFDVKAKKEMANQHFAELDRFLSE